MRISFLVLTYNRADVVERVVPHNLANSGAEIHELVWVDNGSTDRVLDIMRQCQPDVCVLNKTNLGVSKGYNRAYAMATGDYVVIVDSDVLLPDGWLALFLKYLKAIPNTGVACIYYRLFQPQHVFEYAKWANGLCYIPAFPVECRFLSRELLVGKIGYLHEDFGLYGYEDVEWRRRATRVCREHDLLTYVIPGVQAIHLGPETEAAEYRAFKEKENDDTRKLDLLKHYEREGHLYFNPFG